MIFQCIEFADASHSEEDEREQWAETCDGDCRLKILVRAQRPASNDGCDDAGQLRDGIQVTDGASDHGGGRGVLRDSPKV